MSKTIKRNLILAHMRAADSYAKLSYCKRLKVGSLLVKGDSILSFGYNGTPAGEPNVCEIGDTTNPDVVHAERNALKKMYRSANSSEGSIMFQTDSPCRSCAIEEVDAGIKVVFYRREYRLQDGIKFLLSRGVLVYQVEYSDNPDIDDMNVFAWTQYGKGQELAKVFVSPRLVKDILLEV